MRADSATVANRILQSDSGRLTIFSRRRAIAEPFSTAIGLMQTASRRVDLKRKRDADVASLSPCSHRNRSGLVLEASASCIRMVTRCSMLPDSRASAHTP